MSDAFKVGQQHAQQNKPLPPQGQTPAQTYKEFAAGHAAGKK